MYNDTGLTPEQFSILSAPFAPHEHEFKPPYNFIYIKETPVYERIELVDLSWEWKVETVSRFDPKGTIATSIGHLTICGVTRSGEGSQAAEFKKGTDIETGETEKGSETDALKRAARKFGIGRYLLRCPDNVKGYGKELEKWIHSLIAAEREDWSPDKFVALCLRDYGLKREHLAAAASHDNATWRTLTYKQKYELLGQMLNSGDFAPQPKALKA